jgi:hypothetical protein
MLFEQLQYKLKKRGPHVPLGMKSRKEEHEIGTAYVRKLQDEGRSQDAAIDETAKTHPDMFGKDAGASLANFIKRGHRLD